MKEKLNLEAVYVLNQPKHIILSVVVVNCSIPLIDRIHEDLDKLVKFSDVIFIFCEDKFINNKKINKRKFTSLYQACGFIESSGNLAKTLFTVLEYSKEIFKKHIGITISNLDDINLTDTQVKNLIEINGSAVMKPVFKIRRLNSDELYESYSNKEFEEYDDIELVNFKLVSFILKLFNKKKEEENDTIGMYKCYTSDSRLLYFKNGTINILLNFANDERMKSYIDSFIDDLDIRGILSSMIKKLNIDSLNQNIEDLEINNLRTTKQITTKRKIINTNERV